MHIKGPDKLTFENLFSETTPTFFCGKFVKMDQWLIKNEIHSPICFDPIPQGIMLTWLVESLQQMKYYLYNLHAATGFHYQIVSHDLLQVKNQIKSCL